MDRVCNTPKGSVPARRAAVASMTQTQAYRGPMPRSRPGTKRIRSRAAVLEQGGNGATPQGAVAEKPAPADARVGYHGVHHIGLLCENLERSLDFYSNTLGLEINRDRPDKKLPYRGAWLWIGPEMIHLMELPNPDPKEGRPVHGGRDRHFCVGVESVEPLVKRLTEAGIKFTESMSGRPAVFFRDPDMNCLEIVESKPWRFGQP